MDLNLNAKDLQKQIDDREKQQTLLFEDILKKANLKIKMTHEMQRKTECIFEIPQMLFGQPRYDIEACMIFLMYKLKENKFKVKRKSDTEIKISWTPKEKNKKKKITRHIKEAETKKKPKSKKKKSERIYGSKPEPAPPMNFQGPLRSSFDHLAARAELIRQFENSGQN